MKNKKLSLQQKKNMVIARANRASAYDLTVKGILIAHRGKTIECLSDSGALIQLQNSRAFDVVVGDRLLLGLTEGKDPELLEHEDRINVLYRIARDGHKKSLAANIDLACVVLAIEPEPWPQVIAQYYTHLQSLAIPCCFVLNKIDQGAPPEWLEERFIYLNQKLNIPYLQTSAHLEIGLDKLRALLKDKTSIIIGPSGAGKSSLLQKLLDNEYIRVGSLSSSAKGQHTTSVTQLYCFDNNTQLIDSPGIRQLAMEHFSLQDLLKGFNDFQQVGCRFKDCDHVDSKGCQVFDALKNGSIPQHRYEDYLYLRKKFLSIHRESKLRNEQRDF